MIVEGATLAEMEAGETRRVEFRRKVSKKKGVGGWEERNCDTRKMG